MAFDIDFIYFIYAMIIKLKKGFLFKIESN